MRRILIAAGCDAYVHLNPLRGAEEDARQIFDTLLPPAVGDYDAAGSALLLSPTTNALREQLRSSLFGEPIDTLTFFFAGHGAVKSGSLYLAAADSEAGALSATAFSLGELFRMVAEARPAQTYIIIDACEAGGLIEDLSALLKSDMIGKAGTPGVTLLATAAADQAALEGRTGGLGTAALLACVNGQNYVQDSAPVLDLVEIGRAVSVAVSAAGGQIPVVWGLNLYGPPSFCRNPHATTGDRPLRSLLIGWPDTAATANLELSVAALWEPYVTVGTRWNPRSFLDALTKAMADVEGQPALVVALHDRVAEAFAVPASQSADRFREIEVRAACIVALLRHSGDQIVRDRMLSAVIDLADRVENTVEEVAATVAADRFALLIPQAGMTELYQLPIRLSKLIGWAAFAIQVRRLTAANQTRAATAFTSLLDCLFDHYSLSLVTMNDCQSPYLLTGLSAASTLDTPERAERLFGHYFSSFLAVGGRPARIGIEPERITAYLLFRDGNQLDDHPELCAQPSEVGAVLLRTADALGLTDEIDPDLAALDHIAINAYLPDTFQGFADERIKGGVNASYRIGHDVWTVADLLANWPQSVQPATNAEALGALLASLLFSDRTPWFLLPQPAASASHIQIA